MKSIHEDVMTAAMTMPDNYDSSKLRKEVDAEVSQLAVAGGPLNELKTYRKALSNVAQRYNLSGPQLSQEAHVADWMKKRRGEAMKYLRDLLMEESRPALPGMEYLMKLPRQLLVDDEVIDLGDGRLTLSVVMEQLGRAEGIVEKEAAQCADRAKVLWNEQAQFKAQREIYEAVATEAAKLYGVGPQDLIYDREKKAWTPR